MEIHDFLRKYDNFSDEEFIDQLNMISKVIITHDAIKNYFHVSKDIDGFRTHVDIHLDEHNNTKDSLLNNDKQFVETIHDIIVV